MNRFENWPEAFSLQGRSERRYGERGYSIYSDIGEMQKGWISPYRFGYRTTGNVLSAVVSFFGLPGALGSIYIDTVFWAGEYGADNYLIPWYNQLYNYCSDPSWMFYRGSR